MEYKIEAGNKGCGKFLTTLMPSILEQLKLINSKRAVLVKVTDDIPSGMTGATYDIAVADCYLILIKKPKRLSKTKLIEMAVTLSHEMVHVKQLAKGQMKYRNKGARIWMGKRYSAKVPYLDQPWELQALAQQEIITRRAFE